MASFAQLMDLLAVEYPDPSERGLRFEPILRDALVASPSHQFSDVWLWDDWPGRDGPDRGIDLVAEDLDGGLWGIQSKLYDVDASLTWGELSTWVAATRAAPWTHRMLVSPCDQLSRNAKRELMADEATTLLIGDELASLPMQWPDRLAESPVPVAPVVPRPHQRDAVAAVCGAFETGQSRVQAHMACGSGKTFTALWVYERLRPNVALVLVPSLNLMAQTIREWTANATDRFRYLPVCSDVLVAEDKPRGEDADLATGDLCVLDTPATTNVDQIARFLAATGDERRVVFCTYQSSDVLADAGRAAGVRFGLAVADEAHRTTGRGSSVFSTVLDDERLPADRRLFMTATPRVFSAATDGDEEVQSMDDASVYGEVVYELGFGAAVDQGLLVDYEVVVVAVEDPEIRRVFDGGGHVELKDSGHRIEARALAALECSLRAVDEFDMSRLISFHSRIKRAKDYAAAVEPFQRWRGHTWTAQADTVNGAMTSPDRKRRLRWLRQTADSPRLLTNARCLTEGVDVPSLDGIIFADPRRSQIDIVQAVGRVMRTDPHRPDKVGRIIIPLVVPRPDEVDSDNVFADTAFKPVWDVIRALKAHDFRLESELNRLRGLTAIGPINTREFTEATRLRVIGVDDLDAFNLAVLDRTTSPFWWTINGPLRQFVEREGHPRVPQAHVERFDGLVINLGAWVNSRRKDYRSGVLPADRLAALGAIEGWVWDPYEADFQAGLTLLRQFVDREAHARVPIGHSEHLSGEEFKLGVWVRSRRREFSDNQLSQERIAALEAIEGWEWNPAEADFKRGLMALRQFVDREGHTRVPRNQTEQLPGVDLKLGAWVHHRRHGFQKGRLTTEQIEALEVIDGWEWDPLDADYQAGLAALRRFVDREGHPRVPRRHIEHYDGVDIKLGSWVSMRRRDLRQGRLSPERIAALEAIEGWVWDSAEADYQRGLTALRNFVDREGHPRVPEGHVESVDRQHFRLGVWVGSRRRDFANDRLSPERIAALEAIEGWVWDPAEADYQRGLTALRSFVDREGHARVPQAHVEHLDGQDFNLGTWVTTRRVAYGKGELSPERSTALEAIGGWVWDPIEADFQRGLTALRNFVDREGHRRVPVAHVEHVDGTNFKLGRWINSRRDAYRKGKLPPARIAALEAIEGWAWDPAEADFQEGLAVLRGFVKREGHAQVPQRHIEHVDGTDFKLGTWVSNRRTDFKKTRLSAERMAALEAIEGWVWDPGRRQHPSP